MRPGNLFYRKSWPCTGTCVRASLFSRWGDDGCCAWCRRAGAGRNEGRTITPSCLMVRLAFARFFTPSVSAFLDRINANAHTIFHLGCVSRIGSPPIEWNRQYKLTLCDSPVSSFRIRRPALVLLLGLLAVITIILVLPDVDLLDTAFQRNTSPIALRAHFHSVPQFRSTATIFCFFLSLAISLRPWERQLFIRALAEPLQILHHSLRC